jgi:CubicO group peptidase (beta-lactamase class C family)
VASSCSSSEKAEPTVDTAPSAVGCPSGTSLNDRLCVAPGPQAEQAAALVRSTFQNETPGALIFGVWQDGKPLVVGALGNSLTGVPATVDMHHRLGNISTPMLATVLLQQVEAGKLALTDPLSKWFPELPSADVVTIDMLAHHTSGYRQYTAVEAFQKAFYVNPFKRWNVDDVIAFGVAGGPLYPPGTSWNFSDTDILILAKVLEKATGRPFDELVKEGVLDRLGMKNTVPPVNAALPEPVLHSYTGERDVWEDATFWDPSWTGHAGGLGSN